ncbi:MAG: DUF3570 domain-containing protein [Bacteroidetes bacterium]|nr:DUF3570 domain-containing protein [Bacteroidota bacterium]
MRKLSLSVIAFFFQLFSVFAQDDSTAYKSRKLQIDEVNFVSGYYRQDGNNSAVTGGIGTEQLSDFANTLELKLIKTDTRERKHNFSLEMGIDHYTSASSDRIDPNTLSSASRGDTRFYPSLNYSLDNTKRGFITGIGLSYSKEFDYQSVGVGANFAKASRDKNREVAIKFQAYFDSWKVIYPVELRPGNGDMYSGHHGDNERSPRNSYSASLSYSQVLNQRLQLAVLADLIFQQGLLATKYQRVYFTDNSERVENLPGNRLKLPVGLRASYFLDDRFILRVFYRFYTDNWGINGHTASLELPIKLSPFVSLSPFYRYYTQNAANYFAPYGAHIVTEEFYTSDYDLSKFQSHFFGTGIRFMPEKGVFKIRQFSMLEIRYGHYIRNTGLHSDIISLNARFK